MKKENVFAGIDVSKATLDICLIHESNQKLYTIKNTVKSISGFFLRIQKQHPQVRMIIAMESTGYYNWPCYEALSKLEGFSLYVINPLHLKKSMGLIRGKNDRIDAMRIAGFVSLHYSAIKETLIPRKQIRHLQALLAHRNRLVATRSKFSVPSAEIKLLAGKTLSDQVKKDSQALIKVIKDQINRVESQIMALIDQDQDLKEKYNYLESVQGVGKVLAWTMLVKTNEFKSINEPRKLACYAGVVPFEFQSGTSIHKRPRVSPMADKSLKKLLHLSAMRAVRLKGDLQDYYQRKVAEGKNKMLALNAVRNKIVARICSVIKNKRFYQNNLHLS